MTVLAIVAHPDDEVIGVGGTLAKHAKRGDSIHVIILSKTGLSRNNEEENGQYQKIRREQAKSASNILGVDSINFYDFPENEFDSVPLLDIVQIIEKEIEKHEPKIIYTHHYGDLNISHEYTCRAVVTAARPLPDSDIHNILAFETISSTEWSLPRPSNHFSPQKFVDIQDTLEIKIAALSEYEREMKQHPHPRSIENIRRNAVLWGAKAGVAAAEPFEVLYDLWK